MWGNVSFSANRASFLFIVLNTRLSGGWRICTNLQMGRKANLYIRILIAALHYKCVIRCDWLLMMRKKILVVPLDWGLGHATRCIPVIRELLASGHEVLIVGEGAVVFLLQEEFPQMKTIPLRGYRLRYSHMVPAWLKTIFMLPNIIFRMWAEHSQLKKIIAGHNIDVVISDNRFGLWNKKIRSVYITHQVMIKCPNGLKSLEPLLHWMHKWVIKKYDHCWIPDYAGASNISGDLAHQYPILENVTFINPLSRFTFKEEAIKREYDLCFIISGPEPSRSDFEKIILAELNGYQGKAIVILGKPGNNRDETCGNTRVVSHLRSKDLEEIIAASGLVICRSGYSGIMDLVAMKKDAFLVPTPGQTEQEYLAEYLSSKKVFAWCTQAHFSLKNIKSGPDFSVQNMDKLQLGSSLLVDAIKQL
ncbi:glycosyltransferase [soil metagenome]